MYVGAGEEGGQEEQVLLANGMPHHIIIPQESRPFRKQEPNRSGDQTSTQPDPRPGLAALLPARLGGDGALGLSRPGRGRNLAPAVSWSSRSLSL